MGWKRRAPTLKASFISICVHETARLSLERRERRAVCHLLLLVCEKSEKRLERQPIEFGISVFFNLRKRPDYTRTIPAAILSLFRRAIPLRDPWAPVQESGVINVIQLDTDTNKFYHVTETGRRLILPYDADN